MPSTRKLFGTDGIRGLANVEPLTPQTILRLAQAGAAEIGRSDDRDDENRPASVHAASGDAARRLRVVVGRDTRLSGDFLESALIAGLTSMGADVLRAGTLPTPGIAFLTRSLGADAGVALTASHNLFEDNGIKFFRGDGYKLSDRIESRIEARLLEPSTNGPTGAGLGRVQSIEDAGALYVGHALGTLPAGFSLRGLRIAVDCANGSAHVTTPAALRALGAEVFPFHTEPDGVNINHACGSTHPEEIARRVRETGASVGISHDGDADRLILCDETAEIVDGDEVLAIAALDFLRRGALRKSTLVTTVMSNFGLDETLAAAGGYVLRTAVGDRYVLAEMKARGLNVGGEQSGHLIFRDHSTTGDGLVSALQILRVLVESGKPLSELKRCLTKYPQAQRNLNVRSKPALKELSGVTRAISGAERALGAKGRVLVRYSGTEAKVRVLVEGRNAAEIGALADAIAHELTTAIG